MQRGLVGSEMCIRDRYMGYRVMLESVPDPIKSEEFNSTTKSLDDYMFEEKAKAYALAFEQQFHVAVYYAYMKLKEQEIRNICYIADLITLKEPKNQPSWKRIVVPFKDVY
eukprot:TRINITY_DN17911_c0_g1_i4.p4 TRINITY_DN17911_c0_g1~~TRINITY_DN17911_c0_g1_i4.p4  ORF type:complete len:111 (-),score=29.54 TRINITY_DN17911_c0_g1_i4:87-419(-)